MKNVDSLQVMARENIDNFLASVFFLLLTDSVCSLATFDQINNMCIVTINNRKTQQSTLLSNETREGFTFIR
jgi:hypothetical protein